MSVINQMLKDLDKRQQEPVQSSTTSAPNVDHKPHSQRWVIIILVLLLVISLGVIVWQKLRIKLDEKLSTIPLTAHLSTELITEPITEPKTQPTSMVSQSVNNTDKAVNAETINTETTFPETTVSEVAVSKVLASKIKVEQLQRQENASAKTSSREIPKDATTTKLDNKLESKPEPTVAPTLTISRKQLTPDQLASKKIAQAEEAIANKEIKKAEQLFEDVLLIVPSHKSARKQLAALWFGKQSYQAALNLLSRGLDLDEQDTEFRIMKARIYLSQGQIQSALDTLKVLDNSRLIEYQSLLASTAQQLTEFSSAEKAYNMLTELAPNVGRWWLGLAIAQDSQSKFSKAKISYQHALKQQDLSSETAQFAQNRILELGE